MLLSFALLASGLAGQAGAPEKKISCGITVFRPSDETHYSHFHVYRTRDLRPDEVETVKEQLQEQLPDLVAKIGGPHDTVAPRVACGELDAVGSPQSWGNRFYSIDPYYTIQPGKKGAKLQHVTLGWRGNQGNSEGFNSASIGLTYTFLQCAGEIHFAYSLDRSSFKASRGYFIPAQNFVAGKSGHDEMVLDLDPPPAPTSIRLVGTVRDKSYPVRLVGSIDDRFAGEALGMGCFDGQTRKLGTVAQLVGAGATPEKVKAYLAELEFDPVLFTDGGAPLKSAGVASAAAAQARAKLEAEALEAQRREEARLREANDAALKRAAEQRAAIEATLEQGRQAQSAYRESMDKYRQVAAAAEAQRQAYEARAAAHRACLAGDQAACQRYISGN